jgi:CheY-like chemotaxis protein
MPPKDTIVVADDDKVVTTLVSDFLRKKGYNVFVAFDAMQAMMGVRNLPKAVILDVGMPGGTGIDVLKKIKSMNKTSHIPVIILTASSDPKLADEARSLGAEDFLTKPVDLGAVNQAVRRALGLPDEPAAT